MADEEENKQPPEETKAEPEQKKEDKKPDKAPATKTKEDEPAWAKKLQSSLDKIAEGLGGGSGADKSTQKVTVPKITKPEETNPQPKTEETKTSPGESSPPEKAAKSLLRWFLG